MHARSYYENVAYARRVPVPVLKLQRIRIESVRDGVTKRKLADDFLRHLDFTVSQTEDHSSGVFRPAVI